jgi:hypothetical protein
MTMPTCPVGHDSPTDDFCDVCGREINGTAQATTAVLTTSEAPAAQDICALCGEVRLGRFCEVCGHDSLAPVPDDAPVSGVLAVAEPEPRPEREPVQESPVTSWTAVVSADRTYFDSVVAGGGPDAAAVAFPQYCPDRRFPLQGHQITIGRRSRSRGIFPDIDLIGPPEDPGVSHNHALLVGQPDGGWMLVDLGSTNGTTVNSEPESLRADQPRPIAEGDRIHVGAWTTITLVRQAP